VGAGILEPVDQGTASSSSSPSPAAAASPSLSLAASTAPAASTAAVVATTSTQSPAAQTQSPAATTEAAAGPTEAVADPTEAAADPTEAAADPAPPEAALRRQLAAALARAAVAEERLEAERVHCAKPGALQEASAAGRDGADQALGAHSSTSLNSTRAPSTLTLQAASSEDVPQLCVSFP
jgi:hypothetical protein